MRISIIIPVINEEEHIGNLVRYLSKHGGESIAEILVIDGGSSDRTVEEASKAGATVLYSPKTGRACQMNYGVEHATGNLIWFVHADVVPPASFVSDIQESLDLGFKMGGYRFRFDSKRLIHRILSWATRLPLAVSRGGDQTIFITREFFEALEGYREDYVIMEEYELMRRARKLTKFRIIPKDVVVSARKYEENSWLQVNRANFVVYRMFVRGENPQRMKETYHRMIKHPKDRVH